MVVSAADIRAGVARELRALAEDGRVGSDALRDAIAITAAKIRNAPALAGDGGQVRREGVGRLGRGRPDRGGRDGAGGTEAMTKGEIMSAKPGSLGVRVAPKQHPDGAQVMHVSKAVSREAAGSDVGGFNLDLVNRTVACARLNIDPNDSDAARQNAQSSEAVIAAMRAFKPTDEIEGMLAAQAVMLHHLAMEAGRRAMLPKQPTEVASKLRKDAANSARGMADMVDALARHRGKGPQVIRVEKMLVSDGGQAVVGNVTAGASLPATPAIGRGAPPIPMLDAEPVKAGREGERDAGSDD